MIWYVLYNSPEIDMYRAKFKSEFSNKDTKKEFPGWFGKQIRQCHVDNNAGVRESSELFTLACGPSRTPISINSCVVNGVRFVVHSRDERRTTQNSGICSPAPDGEMYYEDDPDVIHVDNSSNLALSTSLNDLKITALHIDGQSIDVDAPPDIIDVDEDDDIIDEEDPIPHDLADYDDEDHINLDIDDGVNVVYSNVARGHGGKGTRKPNLGGRRAGRMHTRQNTPNLELKAITDNNGPVLIRFKFVDRETLVPLGDHATHWANYLGELIRELPLHYLSLRQMPLERKAGFDLCTHMESDRRPKIYAGIQQHLQKIYNVKKATLKERYWVPDPKDGTYDEERIRRIESLATREYPSLIHTFFLTHTAGGVFLNSEDKALYLESQPEYGGGSESGGCGDDEPGDDEDDGEDEVDADS
nr:hypothetical protein [Tanacetum cinerariifolium]